MTLTRELANHILDVYGKAWTEQDTDLILSIFHPDATYQERALGEPLRGHEEIRKYWDEKVGKEQSDITFKILDSMISGNTLIAEWEANFMSGSEGRVDLKEVALIEVEGTKIRSLREYFDARREVDAQYREMTEKYLRLLPTG